MPNGPAPVFLTSDYTSHVNPRWVALLNLLQMNVKYDRCFGSELFTADGRRILDYLSGYCVHNIGHNHPHVIQALKDEMDRCGPAMLQSHVPEIAGELARRLGDLAGGELRKVFFGAAAAKEWRPQLNLRARPRAGPVCFAHRIAFTG